MWFIGDSHHTSVSDIPDSWKIYLPLPVFTKLMTEALNQLNKNITVKGNDMLSFLTLTASSFPINGAY